PSKLDGKCADFKARRLDGECAWAKATSKTTCGSSASRSRLCAKSWAKSPNRIVKWRPISISCRRSPGGTFASLTCTRNTARSPQIQGPACSGPRKHEVTSMSEDREKGRQLEPENVKEIFAIFSEKMPALLNSLTDSIYGKDASAKFGQAVANFYTTLKKSGM